MAQWRRQGWGRLRLGLELEILWASTCLGQTALDADSNDAIL